MEKDTLKIWNVKNDSRLCSDRLFRVFAHSPPHRLPRSHVLVSRWVRHRCAERCLLSAWSQCVRKAPCSWWTPSRAKCWAKPLWSFPLYSARRSFDSCSATIFSWRETITTMCILHPKMVGRRFGLIPRKSAGSFVRKRLRFGPRLHRAIHGDLQCCILTVQVPTGFGECVSMDLDTTYQKLCTASTDRFCYVMSLRGLYFISKLRCP